MLSILNIQGTINMTKEIEKPVEDISDIITDINDVKFIRKATKKTTKKAAVKKTVKKTVKKPTKKTVKKTNKYAPKTPEAEANQAKGRFKPGQSGNKSGWNFRRPTREFREKCHDIMINSGMDILANLLTTAYNNNNLSDALDIIKFITSYAYGTPTPVPETDDPIPTEKEESKAPVIVISKDVIKDTLKSDEEYN